MSIQQLSEEVSVCGQIGLDDLEAIAQLGFKTLVNNRPDGESPNQPSHAEIQKKAETLGLAVHYLPLGMGQAPCANLLKDFKHILAISQKPLLAYCRSGNRSTQIYLGACALPQKD